MASRLMSRIKKYIFPAICIIFAVCMVLLGIANRQLIDELARQGKEYTAITPVAQPPAGKDGRSAYDIWIDSGYSGSEIDFLESLSGRDGRPPTMNEIGTAVREYCSRTGECEGSSPTDEQVLRAVQEYCAEGRCRGTRGADAIVTQEQIASAVAAYCANDRCRGAAGSNGSTGAPGTPGANGRTTQAACVLRTENSLTVQRWATKYTDEDDTAWRDWYNIPGWSPCINPVDLR